MPELSDESIPLPGALDLRLVGDCLLGHDAAVSALCARLACVPAILAALNRRMGRPLAEADLEDTAQEVVLKIWSRLKDYEGRAQFESWTYRFCFLVLMNQLRRRNRLTLVTRFDFAAADATDREPAETELLDFERITQELDRIGSPDADVIRLKFYHDLSFREIGAALKVSATSAKGYYHRGMDLLRRRLGKEETRTK